MKTRRFFIAIPLLLLLLCNACVEQYDAPKKTEKVKEAYQSWDQCISSFLIHYANAMFNLNAWYVAPDELKNDIEDYYFPSMKIRQLDENTFALQSHGSTFCKIEMDEGVDLHTVGASWRVTVYSTWTSACCECTDDYRSLLFSSAQPVFYIESQLPDQWHLYTSNSQSEYSKLNLTFAANDIQNPKDIFEDHVSISGDGTLQFKEEYGEEKSVTIDFSTTTPLSGNLRKNSLCTHWTNGSFNLKTYSSIDEGWDAAITLKSTDDWNYSVDILYKNVTESWNFPDDCYNY